MKAWLECADCRCTKGSDIEMARRQLGREPEGMTGVAARCSYGAPVVLVCSPIIIRGSGAAEPFPTLYWLSCPHLKERVGSLEGGPAFPMIRNMINEDASFREALTESSDAYKAKRRLLYEGLQSEVKAMIGGKATEDLLGAGPGGVKDPVNLKCLHIHLANYLAGMQDPVGLEVARMLKKEQTDSN